MERLLFVSTLFRAYVCPVSYMDSDYNPGILVPGVATRKVVAGNVQRADGMKTTN